MIKDAHEVDALRLAGQATIRVYETVPCSREGDSEGRKRIQATGRLPACRIPPAKPVWISANIPLFAARIANTANDSPGTIIARRRMPGGGDTRPTSPRTMVLNHPADKMLKVFEIVQRAQTAALAASKPGVQAMPVVDAAARNYR